MDQDTLTRITEPFFTTKSEGKGTGLGMSMVDGFVKQSGGVMKISSAVGRGTTIHMLFRCDDGDLEPASVKAQKAIIGRVGERETILVVEDKEDVGDYAEAVLVDFGYTVIRADSAETALSLLTDKPAVDVLFSDIIMKGVMNGVQLAREVSHRWPAIKILLTTGYTDNAIDLTDNHGTAFDVVTKPYRRGELTTRIRAVIDGPDGIS